MRLWQYRKAIARTAITHSQPPRPSIASRPAGNSSKATKPSRDIHEVRGLKNTCSARRGRPISSQTHNRPRPTNAKPNKSSQGRAAAPPGSDAATMTLVISRPLPTPPPMKLPAARQSQLVCCQGLGPNPPTPEFEFTGIPPCCALRRELGLRRPGAALMCPPCPKDSGSRGRCPALHACESSGSSAATARHCSAGHPGRRKPAHRQCRR